MRTLGFTTLVRWLCGGVFALSAIAKTAEPWETRRVIEVLTDVSGTASAVAVLILVILEWGLAAWLFSAARANSALAASGLVLAAGAGVIVTLIARGWQGGCGCGLPWFGEDAWPLWAAFCRNIILVALVGITVRWLPDSDRGNNHLKGDTQHENVHS